MPGLVNRTEAVKKPTHHQFIPGIGHLDHGAEPSLPAGRGGKKNCDPPPGTRDGSLHKMKASSGIVVVMKWITAARSWGPKRPGVGNRMAWTPKHLSVAGWELIGPAA